MAQTLVVNDFLRALADRGRFFGDRRRRRRRASREELVELCEQLLTGRGEASGAARARDILDAYEDLDSAGRTFFFRTLETRFGPDRATLSAAVERYLAEPSEANAKGVEHAAEPRRTELLRRLNLAPGGTAALVRMRVDLIARLANHPTFWVVEDDFARLFTAWFNRGFLMLQRIDWQTSAAILEKIIRYEAVHEIAGWDDLRRRIDLPDRRLYAFFHPRLGDDPLIFVEVALTAAIPDAIGPILAREREPLEPAEATVAVFYSISNCQKGLRGISFGSFLIKQVAEDLQNELPHLRTFATLSPVPGFADWLAAERRRQSPLIGEEARAALEAMDAPGWWEEAERCERIGKTVLPLAAWYLTRARDAGGRVVDPVARFHLGNGARLERIDWAADLSERGLRNAHGVMVNYLYDLDEIERNHERYANENAVVAASVVTRLTKGLKAPNPDESLTAEGETAGA